MHIRSFNKLRTNQKIRNYFFIYSYEETQTSDHLGPYSRSEQLIYPSGFIYIYIYASSSFIDFMLLFFQNFNKDSIFFL